MHSQIFFIFLIIIYATIPPLILFYLMKLVYKDGRKDLLPIFYLAKFLICLSFLPLLFIPGINLGLIPQSEFSILLIIATIILVPLGLKRARKRKVLHFYIAGVYASFMEEILYRGIIFGLAMMIWNNDWIAILVSSLGFGIWHLKNYYWFNNTRLLIKQFLYTAFIYGPIFGVFRIYNGDIYLAVFFHYLTDATCALAPDWMRGRLVFGGKGKIYSDEYLG